MRISIIIPVYNVEDYLRECVNSVLRQEFLDYEIILVDDGSTDRSGEICDMYAKEYEHIRVIHKNNGGLSDARNVGIENAKGEYILFIDSDDYIGQNSLTYISRELKEQKAIIDVMFLEAYKVYENNIIVPLGDGYNEEEINGKSKDNVMVHLSKLPKYPGSACTKLIRKDLIIKKKLYFEKGLLSEDIDWTVRLLLAANNMAYCDVPYYYYRQNRTNSITNTVKRKNVEDLIYIIEKWASKDIKLEYQTQINAFMAYEYMIALYLYGKMSRQESEKIEERLKDSKWILNYANNSKVKIVKNVCQICGINMVSRLLQLYNDKICKV